MKSFLQKLTFPRFLRKSSFSELENKLGYRFNNPDLLKLSLSHRSYVHSHQLNEVTQSNERLEFLGDSILDMLITEYLFRQYPEEREGVLSKMKSLIVSAKVLARCAQTWDLGRFMLLSGAEKRAGGGGRSSILADAFEAVLGAVYLDGGVTAAKALVHSSVVPIISDVLADEDLVNYKSRLLEYTQSLGLGSPEYSVLGESGPEHSKLFSIGVFVQNQEWGRGEGLSKKVAEQSAARMALDTHDREQQTIERFNEKSK